MAEHLIAVETVLRKGQSLYREDDPAMFWYEVRSGVIRTCRFRNDGSRQVTSFFATSDVFGLEGDYYRTNAEAVTDAVLRAYPHPRRHGEVPQAQAPAFLFQALRHADECIDLLGRRSALARLAAFLLRLDEKSATGGRLALPMSREDIADHLALTVETVSRTFSELHRRGVISSRTPQLINIDDRRALAFLAGDEDRSSGGDRFVRCVA